MRLPAAVATAACCVTLTGCGPATGAAPRSATHPATRSRPARAAAANRLAAQREAQRLLAAARVPAGAARLTRAPAVPTGPALGTPGRLSLVDRTEFWRVAMPFARTLAWVRSHPPAGLHQGGSMTYGGPGGLTGGGYGYYGPKNPAWASPNSTSASRWPGREPA